MQKVKFGLIVAILGIVTSAAIASPSLNISTTYWPPYTDIKNEVRPGILVEVVREVFALMKQDIVINNRPWKRAQLEVKEGIADAAFGAAFTEERSMYSIYPQEPIGALTYVFFILAEKKDTFTFNSYANLEDLIIGAVGGAAVNKIKDFQEAGKKWKNVQLVTGPLSIEMNPLKLQSGRIDCYAEGLTTGLATLKILEKKGLITKEIIPFRKKPIQETGLFIIFSKKAGFTDQHPVVLKFARTLRQFKNSEKYQEIIKKYE